MTPHFTPLPTSTSIIYFRCFSMRLGQIARSVPTHSGSADLGYGAAVSNLSLVCSGSDFVNSFV